MTAKKDDSSEILVPTGDLGASDDFSLELDDGGELSGPASGINLSKPVDAGISLEKPTESDDSLEFDLSLEPESTPRPAQMKEVGSTEEGSSEFELSLELGDDEGKPAVKGGPDDSDRAGVRALLDVLRWRAPPPDLRSLRLFCWDDRPGDQLLPILLDSPWVSQLQALSIEGFLPGDTPPLLRILAQTPALAGLPCQFPDRKNCDRASGVWRSGFPPLHLAARQKCTCRQDLSRPMLSVCYA